jgi:hypothetical protein
MRKSMLFILLVLFFWVWVSESHAPDTTEPDVYGYDDYHVQEDGSLCDRDGVIRGWIHGNMVYDAQWNALYQMRRGRLYGADEDRKG